MPIVVINQINNFVGLLIIFIIMVFTGQNRTTEQQSFLKRCKFLGNKSNLLF
jgi:hypothetical protein